MSFVSLDVNAMPPFVSLCSEIERLTRHRTTVEECAPNYQRALDYIRDNPDDHAVVVQTFRDTVIGASGPSAASIYLVRFCMRVLKWPEIRAAAEEAYKVDAGNASWGDELRMLLEVYA